jgi:hypothetical protein
MAYEWWYRRGGKLILSEGNATLAVSTCVFFYDSLHRLLCFSPPTPTHSFTNIFSNTYHLTWHSCSLSLCLPPPLSLSVKVLVTYTDGSQKVVEIKNDLGLRANDIEGMKMRLEKQGETNIQKISLAD